MKYTFSLGDPRTRAGELSRIATSRTWEKIPKEVERPVMRRALVAGLDRKTRMLPHEQDDAALLCDDRMTVASNTQRILVYRVVDWASCVRQRSHRILK